MTARDPRLLIIDSTPQGSNPIERELRELGYDRVVVLDPQCSLGELESAAPQLALIGAAVSIEHRGDLVRKLKIIDVLMPVLLFSGDEKGGESRTGNRFIRVTSIPSETGRDGLAPLIQGALEKGRVQEIENLPFLIGRDPQVQAIRERIYRVSDKDVTVLITGETGTGKEIIARAIHYFSHRSSGPLIKISCGNLPDQLLESEIFGFQKGAFTDASRNKPGRLELADKGTLFLDEIGDLSLALQVKFLQIFEDRSFSRLGAVQEQAVDARVVAATNFDLSKRVKEGHFRRDLFYRLNVVHIRTQPLRERKEDIPILVDHFLEKYCSLLKKSPLEPSKPVLEQFHSYHWPGNVRELENMVKRAIAMRTWDPVVQGLQAGAESPQEADSVTADDLSFLGSPDPLAEWFKQGNPSLKEITAEYVSHIERKVILEALEAVRWNKRRAAEMLGVSYKTVCNRVKDLKIQIE